MIMKTFNSDNSNIAIIKTKSHFLAYNFIGAFAGNIYFPKQVKNQFYTFCHI